MSTLASGGAGGGRHRQTPQATPRSSSSPSTHRQSLKAQHSHSPPLNAWRRLWHGRPRAVAVAVTVATCFVLTAFGGWAVLSWGGRGGA
eukprot:CAMPEP_0114160038 /NCGR_PEP_ID=MMETSP0043_2-20121206/28124_1 /TAXON_ID=464988 /ORGANISM="Hemiselmis andersenii, Strain CCMP644" /LENGTH=88 /DNA_ID=CAMNT_0001256011 /DNA_START=286 /DNA_END=549 /DNA_ORIENTATION=-